MTHLVDRDRRRWFVNVREVGSTTKCHAHPETLQRFVEARIKRDLEPRQLDRPLAFLKRSEEFRERVGGEAVHERLER